RTVAADAAAGGEDEHPALRAGQIAAGLLLVELRGPVPGALGDRRQRVPPAGPVVGSGLPPPELDRLAPVGEVVVADAGLQIEIALQEVIAVLVPLLRITGANEEPSICD